MHPKNLYDVPKVTKSRKELSKRLRASNRTP